jgi:hypothetical protein
MKNRATTIALLIAGALTGCATAVPVVDFYDTDSDTLRRFQIISVLDGAFADAKDLKELGEVEGIYCKKTRGQVAVDDHLAEAQAIDQVKLKAAKKGANYITAPQCVIRDSGDFTNNCYSTLVCTSSAARAND